MDLTYLDVILRLVLSIALSGLIGFERERINKPAGLRTHILVSIGATVVMLVSLSMFQTPSFHSSVDPTRLGAQVISGIGFIGAGTIIHEGATVKGLTTAASLWAAACIGLAIGAGFYIISLAGTFLVFLTLFLLSKIEISVSKKRLQFVTIVAINRTGQLGKIAEEIGLMKILIKNIEMDTSNEEKVRFNFLLQLTTEISKEELIDNISKVEGVLSVKF